LIKTVKLEQPYDAGLGIVKKFANVVELHYVALDKR